MGTNMDTNDKAEMNQHGNLKKQVILASFICILLIALLFIIAEFYLKIKYSKEPFFTNTNIKNYSRYYNPISYSKTNNVKCDDYLSFIADSKLVDQNTCQFKPLYSTYIYK